MNISTISRQTFSMNPFADKMFANAKNSLPFYANGAEKFDGLATADQAIKAGGLDYEVAIKPLFLNNGKFEKVSGINATVRTDSKEVLGYVGDRYKVLQNSEAFEFFDSLVGQGEAIYETGGIFNNGRTMWLLAKLPEFIRVKSTDDIISKYVLLTNSHDGTSPVTVKVTPIRVLCANTLTLALKGAQDKISVRHTTNMHDKMSQAWQVLGFTNKIYDQFQEAMDALASKKTNSDDMNSYFKSVFGETTRASNVTDEVTQLLETGAGVDDPSLRYTMFHLYNGVTEWVDHHKGFKKGTDTLEAITVGSGAALKQKAMKEALAFV